jgi:hypothetical protein
MMSKKHQSSMTDVWKREFKPGTGGRAAPEWLPNPLSPDERRSRLENADRQSVDGGRRDKS